MRDNKSFWFNSFDFIHIPDKVLSLLFLKDNSRIVTFPLTTRLNPREIREFVREGINRSNKIFIKKKEEDLAQKIISPTCLDTRTSSPNIFMGMTKNCIFIPKGQSSDQNYEHDILTGFDWMCRNAIWNILSELSKPNNLHYQLLIQYKEIILIDENDSTRGFFILKCNEKRTDTSINLYNHFSFHVMDCTHCINGNIVCINCLQKTKILRRKRVTKGRFRRFEPVDGRG